MPAIDLHTHSFASPDGGLRPEHYEAMLASGRLDYVAVTDHNTIAAAKYLQARLGERIIVGEEISTTGGDVVGLYLTEAVPVGLSPHEVVKRVHAQGGLVYLPHPFEHFRKSGGAAMLNVLGDEIDIMEVYNGRTIVQSNNRAAAAWAAIHHVPAAASSDAHGWNGWGRTHTRLTGIPTRDTLCKLLRTGLLVTTHPSLLMLLYPKWNRFRHYLIPEEYPYNVAA